MADQVDLLHHIVWLNYMMAQGLGARKSHLSKPPKAISRPGDIVAKKEQKFATAAEVNMFLSAANLRR